MPLPTRSVTTNSGTVFQGISGLSQLTPGIFVDMDLAAQPDGSLVATRVAVQDPNAVDVVAGPLVQVPGSIPAFFLYGQQVEGADQLGNSMAYDVSKASFKISGQLNNLANLPFTPAFQASNLVAGQNVYLTAPAYSNKGVNNYPLSNTVTLMPQTINGTVTAIESSGDFNIYTITLAPYNLFPALAGQQGATNPIGNPGQMAVYVDGNAALVNTTELAAGSTYRFHGLVFNDGGTLRMDCNQVDDGVAQ
jgi:Domain of unknown function (DUF5666)